MKKSEKVILSVLAIAITFAAYDFLFSGESDEFGQAQSFSGAQSPTEVLPAPKPASVSEYMAVTDDADPVLGERVERLQDLEYQLVEARFNASIAQQNKIKEEADNDKLKSTYELQRMQADLNKQARITEYELQQMKTGATTSNNNIEISSFTTPLDLKAKKTKPISRPEDNSKVHSIGKSSAILSIKGIRSNLSVNQSQNGVKLVSVDRDGGKVTIRGSSSGATKTLYVNTNTSRSFAELVPLTGDTNSQDSNALQPFSMQSDQ